MTLDIVHEHSFQGEKIENPSTNIQVMVSGMWDHVLELFRQKWLTFRCLIRTAEKTRFASLGTKLIVQLSWRTFESLCSPENGFLIFSLKNGYF